MSSQKAERNQLVNNFKLKFQQVKQSSRTAYSNEYHIISFVMDKSTLFVCDQVLFEDIKDRLLRIFTRTDLEEAEAKAKQKGSSEAMSHICSSAKRLMSDDFVNFLEALTFDHFHVAKHLMQALEELLAMSKSMKHESTDAAQNLHTPKHNLESALGVELHQGATQSNPTSSPNRVQRSNLIQEPSPLSRPHPQSGFQETTPLSRPVNDSAMTRSSSSSTLLQESLIGRSSLYSHQGAAAAQSHVANTRSQSEFYEMNTTPRGLALIINNENFDYWSKRQGSGVDVDKLYNMFKYIGFNVTIQPDKTGQEMKTILQKFSQHKSLETVSSLAVIVLTHGSANDCLFGKDGQIRSGQPVAGTYITKMDIIHIFKGSVCRAMEGKPKLFILQACRGEEENPVASGARRQGGGETTQTNPNSSPRAALAANIRQDAPEPEPIEDQPPVSQPSGKPFISSRQGASADTSDMCFVHSSSYGYKAYRTRDCGSPFVAIFAEKVRELARTEEFRDIIQKVQNEFNKGPLANNKMTLPDFSLQLMNKWFLNPPLWADTV